MDVVIEISYEKVQLMDRMFEEPEESESNVGAFSRLDIYEFGIVSQRIHHSDIR